MPELPEVHTIVSQLDRALRGRKIAALAEWDTRKALQPTPTAIAAAVRGARIRRVTRRAKLILIELAPTGASGLADGATLAIHLKLTGRLLLRKTSDPPDQYTHATFALDHGGELRFADVRKFGYIRLFRSLDELQRVLDEYGPEPLASAFSLERFAEILKRRSTKIKPLLLDQAVISGIGNIYSDETLFAAGIDPRRPARSLKSDEVRLLHRAIIRELRAGIRHHGCSDQWYVDAHGEPGSHQRYLNVYGRNGEPCRQCGTLIRKIKFGGRSGHFCPQCQK